MTKVAGDVYLIVPVGVWFGQIYCVASDVETVAIMFLDITVP
jgi:hypothetical protein